MKTVRETLHGVGLTPPAEKELRNLSLELRHCDGNVLATEPKAVRQCDVALGLTRDVGM